MDRKRVAAVPTLAHTHTLTRARARAEREREREREKESYIRAMRLKKRFSKKSLKKKKNAHKKN